MYVIECPCGVTTKPFPAFPLVCACGRRWTDQETFVGGPEPKCLAGTVLQRLFTKEGVTVEGECLCNRIAEKMNQMGCDWVSENSHLIVAAIIDNWEQNKSRIKVASWKRKFANRPGILRLAIRRRLRKAVRIAQRQYRRAMRERNTPTTVREQVLQTIKEANRNATLAKP